MSWRSPLACYPAECQPTGIEALGAAGGFSGAEFWRLSAPRGQLCLRRWPREHPTPERLRQIHDVLAHVWGRGFRLLPWPLPTRDGRTFVEQAGDLWELTPWLPGRADYHAHPSRERLCAAMRTLAAFHLAASTMPDDGPRTAPPPGVARRLILLRDLMSGGLADLRRDVSRNPSRWPELAARAEPLFESFGKVAPFAERSLLACASAAVPLQPCIRDIWHDHVLFDGDAVTGLIDFGAMRTDNVATDVARLLGSLVRDDLAGWQTGLAAYGEVRPLLAEEHGLVRALDESAVLLSPLSWFEWVFRDGRQFASPAAVLARVDENLQRLANLCGRMAADKADKSVRLT